MSFCLNHEIPLSDAKRRQTLPARDGPYWELISAGRALGYRRVKPARSYWIARVRLRNGKYRRHSVGKTDDLHIADGCSYLCYETALVSAKEWFAELEQSKFASDTYPINLSGYLLSCPIGNVYTVGHAIRDFVEWKKAIASPSYYRTLVTHANFHILPRLGSVPLEQFNGSHFQEFVKDILATRPKCGHLETDAKRSIPSLTGEELRKRTKTANSIISILRQAIVMAWENGHFDNERAWRCIRRLPHRDIPRRLHLNRDECRRLLACCQEDLRDLVLGALYTGARSSELLQVEVRDFNREAGGIHFLPGKTRYSRFVFLPDEGFDLFDKLTRGKSGNEPVFRRRNGNRWYCNFQYYFRNAVAAAGLPKEFCFHGLRHTYASQLIEAGTPAIVVSRQLGHASTRQVDKTYGHLAPQIREAEIRQRFTPITGLRPNASTRRRPLYATINLPDADHLGLG